MTKLCSECKWSRGNAQFPTCEAPRNPDRKGAEHVGPLARRTKVVEYCTTHRREGWLAARILGVCGKQGRWWEERL